MHRPEINWVWLPPWGRTRSPTTAANNCAHPASPSEEHEFDRNAAAPVEASVTDDAAVAQLAHGIGVPTFAACSAGLPAWRSCC